MNYNYDYYCYCYHYHHLIIIIIALTIINKSNLKEQISLWIGKYEIMIRYTWADPGNLKGGSFTSAAIPTLGHTHYEAAHRVPFQVILYNSTLWLYDNFY